MKCFYAGLKLVLLLSFFGPVVQSVHAQGPSWGSGFPKILPGATSLDIAVQADASGSVYYCLYTAAQPGISSVQLKNAALNGGGSGLFRRGSVAVSAYSTATIPLTGLTANSTYYTYVVAESAAGLMSDSKVSATSSKLSARLQGFTNYSNNSVASYLMYFPESYYKDSNNYPILIYLNGDGEMSKGGSPNPNALLATGLPQVINNGKDIPMIMCAPQGVWAWDNTASDLNAFIEYIKLKYRVNNSQIFLTGISAGGKGVFQYTDVYKNKIRAIVPISTWPEPTNVLNFIGVPVWSFMGSSDTYGGLFNWMAALKLLGADATYTSLNGGHDPSVWNSVYDGSRGDIYNWLLTRGGGSALPPVNTAPAVNAGTDQAVKLPQAQVLLTGTATDADGSVKSVVWTKISGPSATLANTSTLTLTLSDLQAGTYTFQLTATDNSGTTASDQIVLTVTAANIAPVVNAGADVTTTLPLTQLLISGSAADADGTISSYAWTKISGPSVTLSNSSAATLTLTSLTAGTYVFQLTAADNTGATASDQMTLNVNPAANAAPVANAGIDKQSTLPLSQLVLVGSASDADGTIASYAWTQVSGPAVTLGNASASSVTLTNLVAGTLMFQLTVKDNAGATGSDQVVVVVNAAANIAPTVNAGTDVTAALPLAQLTWSGSANDPDGSIASVLWTQIAGPAITLSNTTTLSPLLTNLVVGNFIFQLTAKDNSGATSSDQIAITLLPAGVNTAPVVNAGGLVQAVLPQSQVSVNATVTDDGFIASYKWTQLTGLAVSLSNTTTPSLMLNNPLAGLYSFQLSATDNTGLTSSDIVSVAIIVSGNKFPVADAGTDVTVTLPLAQLVLKGTGSDAEGSIAAFQWSKVSGPSVTLTNAATPTVTLTNLSAGVYVFKLNARDNAYASAWDFVTVTVLQKTNTAPVVTAGADVQVTLPQSQVVITGTASDAEGSIAALVWSQVSGTAATLTNINSTTLTISNLVAGTYAFQLLARDNDGVSVTDQMTLTVLPAVVTVVPREFDVNVTWAYNLQGGTWNDFSTTGGGVVGNSMTLTDINQKTSAITLSIAAPFQDGVNNHGYLPGIYPNNVMMYYLRSTNTRVGVLQLSGLDPARQYDFSILGSNVDVWYASDTKYTIAGQSATLNAKSNTTSLAKFSNMKPDAAGILTITVAPATATSTNHGIINAFIMTEHGASGGGRAESADAVAAAIGERESADYVTVYPNPTDNDFNVDLNTASSAAQSFSFNLHDARGVSVFTHQLVSKESENATVKISTESLEPGLYILTVSNLERGIKHLKLIKR